MARVHDNEVDYEDRGGLIRSYFYSGFTYAEIVLMLNTRHNIQLSVSHLKRILRRMGLKSVTAIRAVPSGIRADRGTENVMLQPFSDGCTGQYLAMTMCIIVFSMCAQRPTKE